MAASLTRRFSFQAGLGSSAWRDRLAALDGVQIPPAGWCAGVEEVARRRTASSSGLAGDIEAARDQVLDELEAGVQAAGGVALGLVESLLQSLLRS